MEEKKKRKRPSRYIVVAVLLVAAAVAAAGGWQHYQAELLRSASTSLVAPNFDMVSEYAYDENDRPVTKTTYFMKDMREDTREEWKWGEDGLLAERRYYTSGEKDDDWEERNVYSYDEHGRLVQEDRWYCAYGSEDGGKLVERGISEYEDLPGGGTRRIGLALNSREIAEGAEPDRDNCTVCTYDAEGYMVKREHVSEGEVYETETFERAAAPRIDDPIGPAYAMPATNVNSRAGTDRSNELSYDENGNVESVTKVDNADGSRRLSEERSYDGEGRVQRIDYPAMAGTPASHKTFYYDERGLLVKETVEFDG